MRSFFNVSIFRCEERNVSSNWFVYRSPWDFILVCTGRQASHPGVEPPAVQSLGLTPPTPRPRLALGHHPPPGPRAPGRTSLRLQWPLVLAWAAALLPAPTAAAVPARLPPRRTLLPGRLRGARQDRVPFVRGPRVPVTPVHPDESTLPTSRLIDPQPTLQRSPSPVHTVLGTTELRQTLGSTAADQKWRGWFARHEWLFGV